jgi:hypothetical protein
MQRRRRDASAAGGVGTAVAILGLRLPTIRRFAEQPQPLLLLVLVIAARVRRCSAAAYGCHGSCWCGAPHSSACLSLSLAGGHCSLLLRPPQPGGEDRLSCQNADEISELLKVTVRVRNFQGRTLLSVEIFKSVLPRSKGPPRVQLRFLSCARPLITGLSCSIRLISCRCAPCLGLVLLRVVVVGVQS